MAYLNWIDDDKIITAVKSLLEKADFANLNSSKNFGKNVIDPFSAIFEIAGFGLDYENWIKSETNRQAQKTLQNHVGDFHQTILGECDGWKNLKTGNVFDLVSEKYKIIAEVKNKYNTVSGGKLKDLYYSLHDQVMPKNSKYKDYTAYYVAIIPKKPKRFNIEFTPSDGKSGKKCEPNKLIRYIDGASFYELVSGRKDALEELYNVLPTVINENSEGKYKISDPEKLKSFFNIAYLKTK